MIAFLTSRLGLGLIGAAILAAVIAGLLLSNRHLTHERDAAREDVGAWRTATRHWQDTATAWEHSFHASEALRAGETARDRRVVSEEAQACDARVAAARRAGQGIRALVRTEVPRDPTNVCARPPVVDPGRLREALQP